MLWCSRRADFDHLGLHLGSINTEEEAFRALHNSLIAIFSLHFYLVKTSRWNGMYLGAIDAPLGKLGVNGFELPGDEWGLHGVLAGDRTRFTRYLIGSEAKNFPIGATYTIVQTTASTLDDFYLNIPFGNLHLSEELIFRLFSISRSNWRWSR